MNTSVPRSRRAILGAGLGAVAATIASAVPVSAAGDDGQPIDIGTTYSDVQSTTTLQNQTNDQPVLALSGQGIALEVGGRISVSAGGGIDIADGDIQVSDDTHFGSTVTINGDGIQVSYTTIVGTTITINGTGILITAKDATIECSSGYAGTGILGSDVAGVFGSEDTDAYAVGVRGESGTGRGGVFKGAKAQLRLLASTEARHPRSGALGDFFLDKNKRLWFCKGGRTWKQIA